MGPNIEVRTFNFIMFSGMLNHRSLSCYETFKSLTPKLSESKKFTNTSPHVLHHQLSLIVPRSSFPLRSVCTAGLGNNEWSLDATTLPGTLECLIQPQELQDPAGLSECPNSHEDTLSHAIVGRRSREQLLEDVVARAKLNVCTQQVSYAER